MITVKLCFAALGVIRDADTNTISAFNIFEGIVAGGFPLLLQHSAFFVLWQREAADAPQLQGEFTLEMGGIQLVRAMVGLDFEDKLRHRSIVNLSGIAIPQAGQLQFSLVLPDGPRADYIVDVEGPPPVAQQANR